MSGRYMDMIKRNEVLTPLSTIVAIYTRRLLLCYAYHKALCGCRSLLTRGQRLGKKPEFRRHVLERWARMSSGP